MVAKNRTSYSKNAGVVRQLLDRWMAENVARSSPAAVKRRLVQLRKNQL